MVKNKYQLLCISEKNRLFKVTGFHVKRQSKKSPLVKTYINLGYLNWVNADIRTGNRILLGIYNLATLDKRKIFAPFSVALGASE